eukprot:TRINITY_DN1652_c0_g1_i1.p1 TRINITY_DN1652_c0_g1~~TRINITY_DN1652_c0_g1_i1.p1  ORF type:complete len:322 (-),score=58.94 TRINITY_DN1652_c0_g1_i1:133-1098(-)
MSYSRRNDPRVGRVVIEEVDDDVQHSHPYTSSHREPVVEQPDDTPSFSTQNGTRPRATTQHSNRRSSSRDPFSGGFFSSSFDDDPFFSDFGRAGFGSLMNDPFFSEGNDLLASFMSDFGQMGRRMRSHNHQLTGEDNGTRGRALGNSGQSYSFSSISYSSSGSNGQTYEYTRSSTQKNNNGRTVHEVQESERDSRNGVERMTIERGKVDGTERKSRRLIRERVGGGDIRTEEILSGIEQGKGDHFDQEWMQASENMHDTPSSHFDRYLSQPQGARKNSHNNPGVRGIEWHNQNNRESDRGSTYFRDKPDDDTTASRYRRHY